MEDCRERVVEHLVVDGDIVIPGQISTLIHTYPSVRSTGSNLTKIIGKIHGKTGWAQAIFVLFLEIAGYISHEA